MQSWVQEALSSPKAQFFQNPQMQDSFKVVTDLGRKIGTRGQTKIMVVVKDGVVKK